jgi:hypothetical protein
MAESLIQKYKLAALQIDLDRSGTYAREAGWPSGDVLPPSQVVFTLQVGDELRCRVVFPAKELGVPNDLRELRKRKSRELSLRLPDELWPPLRAVSQHDLRPGQPLWIAFSDSCGNLPLMPWERVLHTHLRLPVLRLPKYDLEPVSAREKLDVVLCASSPTEGPTFPVAQVVDTVTRSVMESISHQISMHIFVEQPFYSELSQRLADLVANAGDQRHVQLYNPAEADAASTNQSDPRSSGSAWLQWVRRALGERSTDVVHFVGSGHLWGDQGALAWASDPMGASPSERMDFLTPQQIEAFLTQLGATTLATTLPPHGRGLLFLRLLAYQIDYMRPGSVLLHDMKEAAPAYSVGAAYGCLYGSRPAKAPKTTSYISIYHNPALFEPEFAAAQRPHSGVLGSSTAPEASTSQNSGGADVLGEYTLAKGQTLDILTSSENTPGWLAASQRFLEREAAELNDEEALANNPVAQGKAEALKALSDLIAQHAIRGQKDQGNK